MEHLKRKLHEAQLQHSLKKNKTTVEVSQVSHGSLSSDATLKQQPSESSHRNSQYIDNTVDIQLTTTLVQVMLGEFLVACRLQICSSKFLQGQVN